MNKLNDAQRKKLLDLALDQIDFKDVFNTGSNVIILNSSQTQSITDSIRADPELSPLLSTCVNNFAVYNPNVNAEKNLNTNTNFNRNPNLGPIVDVNGNPIYTH